MQIKGKGDIFKKRPPILVLENLNNFSAILASHNAGIAANTHG